jgi:hypothetical protein
MVPSRLRQFGNRAAQAHAASVITLTQPTPVLVPKDTDIKSLFAANRKLDLLIDEERKGNWSDIFCGGDGTDSDPAIATAALNLTADGKKLNFARAMQGPDSAVWQQSNDKELRKLIKDTGTMRATLKTNIPQDRRRDISYYSPQTREKIKEDALQQRVRGTYGGNLQRYSGRTSAKTTELAVSKVQFNKVVSLNRQFSSIDLTDFYLSEFLPTPEYLSIPLRIFSDAILDELNLRSFIVNGCICFEVVKTMYGLKQSGYLAQQGLIKHLNLHGYTQDQWVPMLFSDSRSDLQFTLTVDDFGIDWDDSASDADYDHLKAVLELKYAITEQKVCTKHLGMTLDYDRSAGTLSLSMPGYISQLLEQHTDRPLSFQQTPALYTPVQYGTKGAQQVTVDPTPAATDIAKQQLQSIVGSLLYYARAVDPSLMTAVCALSAQQSNPTEAATAAADRLLGYVAAYPDNQLVYRSSDMQLKFASDASHNSRPKGRSVGGGIIYAGDADNNNINGAIDAFSSVIGVVVMSAYEAEVAALYMTMQRCEWLRQVFSAFGFKQRPHPWRHGQRSRHLLRDEHVHSIQVQVHRHSLPLDSRPHQPGALHPESRPRHRQHRRFLHQGPQHRRPPPLAPPPRPSPHRPTPNHPFPLPRPHPFISASRFERVCQTVVYPTFICSPVTVAHDHAMYSHHLHSCGISKPSLEKLKHRLADYR